MIRRLLLAALLLASAAVPAHGLDLAARDVIVPVVSRVPGALGTRWYTDLVVTNLTRDTSGPLPIVITYYADGGSLTSVQQIQPRQSLVFNDVLETLFDLEQSAGFIRITSTVPAARISARARVFNRGSSQGEYGQAVTGVPTDALTREHYIPGLSGVAGNRSNVGITNPWNIDVPVSIELFESNGQSRGSFTTTIGPRRLVQYNEIFGNSFGVAPTEGAMIRVNASFPIFAYGSVVRSDTGDSTFIPGTGLATGNELLLPTQCSQPAPVTLAAPGATPAAGWIVMFYPQTDAVAVTQTLSVRYGFTPGTIYENAFKGFFAELTQQQIASIRCEPAVMTIDQNIQAPLP